MVGGWSLHGEWIIASYVRQWEWIGGFGFGPFGCSWEFWKRKVKGFDFYFSQFSGFNEVEYEFEKKAKSENNENEILKVKKKKSVYIERIVFVEWLLPIAVTVCYFY